MATGIGGLLGLRDYLMGKGATVDWNKDTGVMVNGKATNISGLTNVCLLYTSPSPRDGLLSRMPSSA